MELILLIALCLAFPPLGLALLLLGVLLLWAGAWLAAIGFTVFAFVCAAYGFMWPLVIAGLGWCLYLSRDVPTSN